MDIKKDIKFKVSKRLNERTQWDAKSSPNIYELDNFLRKSGYRLVDINDEGSVPELIIKPSKSDKDPLHPEILHDINAGASFYVNVEEYGFLNATDMETIIDGYTIALGVIKHLNSLNLDIIKEEYK